MIELQDYETYKDYYLSNKRFSDGQYCNPEKFPLNEKQIKSKYEVYVKRFDKKQVKTNSKYKQNIYDAEELVRNEDPEADLFWGSLSDEQYKIVKKEMRKSLDFSIIDPCHILSRGSCPQLSNEPLNIIMAPRGFHTYIDQFLNPFSEKHESINREQQDQIWIDIIGEERWSILQQMKQT